MNLNDLREAVENWVCSQFSGKVIWAKDDVPVPPRPFITLELKDPVPAGQPWQSDADQAGTVRRERTQVFSVSINGYGPGVNQSLFDLRESLDLLKVRKILHEGGICYLRDQTDLQDATTRTGSRHEERAVYEPAFTYRSVRTEEVGIIENINIKGEIHGRYGSDN